MKRKTYKFLAAPRFDGEIRADDPAAVIITIETSRKLSDAAMGDLKDSLCNICMDAFGWCVVSTRGPVEGDR